jgi:hypothetical protein
MFSKSPISDNISGRSDIFHRDSDSEIAARAHSGVPAGG